MEPAAVALVTGASRGIGRAVALELARHGYETVATMRDPAAGESLVAVARSEGLPLLVERLDVNDPATVALPTGLRVLVNNAGVETDNVPVEHSDVDAHWRFLFETNVFGLARVTRAAIPIMRAGGGGVICNITSSSVLAPVPFLAMYRASKAAVMALGESLQAEVARFGIRVVEVMPGPIETDMLAASERPSPAIDDPNYRDLAAQLWESRAAIKGSYTPAAEAARRIVAAIEDAGGPTETPRLRYACDDLAAGLLSGWRSQSHDDWIAAMMRAFC